MSYLFVLSFHTVHEVLKTGILKWFAIPFSSGEKCGPLTKRGPLETVEGDSGKPYGHPAVQYTKFSVD